MSSANGWRARGRQVLSPNTDFALARKLRSKQSARLSDFFSFASGLYCRSKLTYARRFAAPDGPAESGVDIITATADLPAPHTFISRKAMPAFAYGAVDPATARYRRPLERSARALADRISPDCDLVLLGSVASPKHLDVLAAIFGKRLRFPIDCVERGDKSRVGLLLRNAREGVELKYASLAGAERHRSCPPKFPPHVSAAHSA